MGKNSGERLVTARNRQHRYNWPAQRGTRIASNFSSPAPAGLHGPRANPAVLTTFIGLNDYPPCVWEGRICSFANPVEWPRLGLNRVLVCECLAPLGLATTMLQLSFIQQLLADARRAIRRHYRKSLAFFVATMALTLAGVFVMPRSYVSEGKLFVGYGRNLSLDPTATTGQLVSISETRETELNSLQEILGSRSLLERVVDAIGPENILNGRAPAKMPVLETNAAKRFVAETSTIAPPTTRDRTHQQAVAMLEKQVEGFVPRKSNTITIRAKTDSPALSQAIVATLMSAYMDKHVRVHHTPGSFEFFQEQARTFEQQWHAAAEKLEAAKNRMGIVTLDGKQKQLEGQISDVANRLLQNAADVSTSEAKIASLEDQIALLPPWLSTLKQEGPNVAADGMRTELYKLQAIELDKSSRFTDDHPQVIAIRQQVHDLEAILNEEDPIRKQTTSAVNPALQALQLQLFTERSLLESLHGKADELTRQQGQIQHELEAANKQDVQLASLQRDVEFAEAQFRESSQKLAQARTNDKLDADKISNLTIVQPASYVARPLGPRKAYVLALGMIVGLLGAIGIAGIYGYFDRLLKTPAEIADLLQLPLLGEIPASSDEAPAVLAG